MLKIRLVIVSTLLVLIACSEKNEDVTDTVNKNGSVETVVQIQHVDSLHDILITSHKVWVKHGVYKDIEYRDTLPALGVEKTTAENENGDKKDVTVPKDYEIYITVK